MADYDFVFSFAYRDLCNTGTTYVIDSVLECRLGNFKHVKIQRIY